MGSRGWSSGDLEYRRLGATQLGGPWASPPLACAVLAGVFALADAPSPCRMPLLDFPRGFTAKRAAVGGTKMFALRHRACRVFDRPNSLIAHVFTGLPIYTGLSFCIFKARAL